MGVYEYLIKRGTIAEKKVIGAFLLYQTDAQISMGFSLSLLMRSTTFFEAQSF